ncbi:MAG: Na/Pi cotransporter family protein [Flavobacteriales bacterium]|nr:Na/Pi cotransporter family protein [Flavobacteriales bacterium]
MEFGLLELLTLAGALALFIHGMKLLSEGLQKTAGARMRRVLDTMTRNPVRGVLTGFSTTAIVQYSSVTIVMVVSFVNAGLLSLRQSIPVIMGANIGTTLKSLLFVWVGFASLKLTVVALPILGVAFPLLFLKGGRIKAATEVLLGMALLFLGLDLLKENVPHFSADALSFLHDLADNGALSVLLFVLIGAVLAIAVQSSSVALALTMAMCQSGTIGYEMAAAIVLGENIGTTLTANIAALVANAWGKRAARAHLLFNVIGVGWALLLFGPYLRGIDLLVQAATGASPYTAPTAVLWALTFLHISFNLINTLLLINFVPTIEKLVTRMVPSRGEVDEEYRLEYIEDPMMPLSPELSLLEARKEVLKFGRLTQRMHGMLRDLLIEKDAGERTRLLERIAKYEDITDRIEVEVSKYLTKTGAEARNEEMSERVRALLAIIGDLERVGDILFQMSKSVERKSDERLWFSPEQRQSLLEMMILVDRAFEVMLENLGADDERVKLDAAMEAEQRINQLRDQLRRAHLKSVESGDHNIKSGMVYNDLFSSCEKVGDHLINVSEALAGEV